MEADNTKVSYTEYRDATFYAHDACLDYWDSKNINNLSPEEQQRDWQHYYSIAMHRVPERTVCTYCHKRIK